jgi:hypothetical protein
LLVLHLLADAGGANEAIVLTPLTRELAITLYTQNESVNYHVLEFPIQKDGFAYLRLLHSTPLTGLPHALMSSVHTSVCDLLVVVHGSGVGPGTL